MRNRRRHNGQSTSRRILILGGARSGKSSFAEELAKKSDNPVTVIASAQAFDEDMRARITEHRRSRPGSWRTIEEPIQLASALARVPASDTAVVDCITVWLGNMFHEGRSESEVYVEVDRFIETMSQRRGTTIVVSNEVGLGIVPATELGRSYRDVLGRVNTRISNGVDRSMFLIAGRALELREVRDLE